MVKNLINHQLVFVVCNKKNPLPATVLYDTYAKVAIDSKIVGDNNAIDVYLTLLLTKTTKTIMIIPCSMTPSALLCVQLERISSRKSTQDDEPQMAENS